MACKREMLLSPNTAWRLAVVVLLLEPGVLAGGPPPWKPEPIIDPQGDVADLCKGYECNGTCPNTDRLCVSYPPCNGDPPGTLNVKVCLHKAFFPIYKKDLLFCITLFVIAILAGATGIGGGGINVPLLMIMNGFTVREAVPLSHMAVMGNALAQVTINVRQAHPSFARRPIIHYEMALLLLPSMLGGNSLGVVIGRVFPPSALIVLSLALLAFASLKTFCKGLHVMKEMKKPREAPPISQGSGGLAGAQSLMQESAVREVAPVRMRIPWKVIGFMAAFNLAFFGDYALMSQDLTGTKRCSALYWVALLGLYPFVFGALVFGLNAIRALAQWHGDRGDPPVDGDPVVTVKMVVTFSLVAMIIGLVAGLLGLGGGEFTVPLLLEFGLLPRVAASTSGFLMVFTTSSNVVHYLMAGTIEPFFGWGVACFFLAMFGAIFGVQLRDSPFMQANSYILVFLIAGVLATSGVLLIARGALDNPNFHFGSFCS